MRRNYKKEVSCEVYNLNAQDINNLTYVHMSSNKLRALAGITKLQEQWQAYIATHIHSIQYVTMYFIVNRNNVNNYI